MPRCLVLFLVVGILVLPFWWFERKSPPPPKAADLVGEVHDDSGPVADAIVRIKGTSTYTLTDDQGRFRLSAPLSGARITAAKEGYYIAGALVSDGPITIHLKKLPDGDGDDYTWVDPTPDPASPNNCGNCHKAIHDEWQRSSHATSATNPRFLGMYRGTDWQGQPDVGWNLLKEHPSGADVCASCHAPTQRAIRFDEPKKSDPFHALSKPSGVHCDFCHKIAGPGTGEFGLAQGRFQLKMQFPEAKRPDPHQLFFGPLDDVDRGDDAFSRFQKDSRLCAACHEGVVFGIPVYTTYSEWLESPAGRAGQSCQQCHTTPTGRLTNIAPGHGGIKRDPATLGNHRFFDGNQLDMLRRSLQLDAKATRDPEGINVEIALTARDVGHRIPTGFIDRQVILFVEAYAGDKLVKAERGPLLPDFLGSQEAGRPGRLYAKVLKDGDGVSPAPFWRADPATLRDTRLRPGETDRLAYRFPPGADRIRVRIVHRRFWKTVADEKRWPSDEQLVEEREIKPS
ncbi:MAG: hypothetical protein K8T89_22275 [Planctomycetes bacterium]|nr:hypothetical protein [Planctomycetota bacterium]